MVERQYSEAVSAACSELSAWLRGEGAAVLSSQDPLAAPLSARTVHLVICLGGDGTMLEVYSTDGHLFSSRSYVGTENRRLFCLKSTTQAQKLQIITT